MAMKKDYSTWSKTELVRELKKAEKRKKYGIVWEDKPEQVAVLCKEKLPVLEEDKSKNIISGSDKPINVLIEGDNYHALSVLNYTHKSAIDVIYIDPPYNTGSDDFKYNDRIVDKEDTYRHSKWLSFMEKRLKMAKNLLKNDGLIFISIDDNESSQLKLLCDEILGENNRLSTHHIQVRYGNKSLNEKKDFQELIEYALIYAKNKGSFKANLPLGEYDLNKFNLEIKELKKPDKSLVINGKQVDIFLAHSYSIKKQEKGDVNFFKETWLSGSIYSGTGHGKTYQKIVEPRVREDGLSTLYKIYGLGEDGLGFRYMINTQKASSSRGKMFTKIPTDKKEALSNGTLGKYSPIINFYDFSPDFGNIRQEGGVALNSGKKPVKMLKQFINYHRNKNATILDFFAGSGSLAHATLAQNEDDGGHRKFIICTNNENNIASDICYPRIRNVIKGFNSTKGLGGNLKYFRTSFVDADPTDKNKRKLVDKSTEMLCLKEDCFDDVTKGKNFKMFTNGQNKHLGIIYDDDGIEPFKKEVRKLNQKIVVYVFSLDDSAREEEFEDVKKLVELRPIPAVILNVYKRIFK
ncbi:MAG: site-specific DNA-methyltransferase [Planctomycetota bacterium]|nr:site-specific DNA-methyltransferase [Planctomycetota bacterium]